MATFTVTNMAELNAAVAAAQGGDTINLAAGTYAKLEIQNRTWTSPVTFTSVDPAAKARISEVYVTNSDYVTFKSLDMGYALAPGQPTWAKMVTVSDSSHINFEYISLYGSLDNNPTNDGDGMAIFNSDYVRVYRSEFQQVRRAIAMGNSNNLEVIENNFHDVRQGGTLFAESQNIRIIGNRYSSFSIVAGDHPDAIQFWETGTTRATKNVLIMDNVILQGTGNSMQGIAFGDNKPEFQYENITILNNLIYQSGYNGIVLSDAVNFRIEGNTVLSARSDGVLHRIYVKDSEQGVIRNNVAEIMITDPTANNNVNVTDSNNWSLHNTHSSKIPLFRDLEARAAATVEGLVVPSVGYQVPVVPASPDAPQIGTPARDGFYMGATLDPLDRINGFEEIDQVAIQGNYTLTLGAYNLVNIESLALLSGTDRRFGDLAGNLYHYDVTLIDANVAAGQTLILNSARLVAGETARIDGSAEQDGKLIVYSGAARDTIIGGAGQDGFFFGDGNFSIGDRIDGGDGVDQVVFRGDYSAGFAFLADTIVNVESIALLSGSDTRFGLWNGGFDYNITSHDGNVAAGARMIVNAGRLHSTESLTFNGAAELDGSFKVLGGEGDDLVIGSVNGDLIYGGLGADRLTGGGGADVFQYRSIAESAGLSYDCLVAFDCTVDRIDLPGDRAGLTDLVSGILSSSSLEADLTAALNSVLGVGDAALFTAVGGTLAGKAFVIADTNGVAGYQSGEDFLVELLLPAQPVPLGADFFV